MGCVPGRILQFDVVRKWKAYLSAWVLRNEDVAKIKACPNPVGICNTVLYVWSLSNTRFCTDILQNHARLVGKETKMHKIFYGWHKKKIPTSVPEMLY
jgi:hypothetical protein